MFALLFLLAMLFRPAPAAERWQLQYFYDQLRSELTVNDFQFSSPERGVAAGFLTEKNKIKPTVLVTSDGGTHWSLVPVKEVGLSLFFLNDTLGWMVAPKGIWHTEDGGRNWRLLNPLKEVQQVYFLDARHGFAVAAHKQVFETNDGGKEWKAVPAAAEPAGNPEFTTYNAIAFANPQAGMIMGWNQPPRSGGEAPDWMSPENTRLRREWPKLSLSLQTRDGGKTWAASAVSIFGRVTCVRLSPQGFGLALIEFANAFEWPSEVHRIDWTTGKSDRVFREKNRLITDIALTPGPAYLAGIEKLDKLRDSPIPGKVKVLKSENLADWKEMDVDYRATAREVMISAPDEHNVWIATDAGMILKLAGAR